MNTNIAFFVDQFASQFDDTSRELFTPETKFRDLEEWSSMMALVIIAMVDDKYKVKLSGNEIKESITIKDIYDKVTSKIDG